MYSRNQGIGVDRRLSPWLPAARPHCSLTLAAIAIPEQMATTRLAGLSPEIGFFAFLAGSLAFAIFGDIRFLSSGADSTITPIFGGGLAPVEFAIREQTGIGRDVGSTKLKHQSALEIESENLAVRFTPFWPKLRLPLF
jgi:hypothetical protein